MKSKILMMMIGSLALSIANAQAASSYKAEDVVLDAQRLSRQCAFRPFKIDNKGRKVYGKLRSKCPNLLVSDRTAVFALPYGQFQAALSDSINSDGGDLNDLRILDRRGRIVSRQDHLLTFGDVVMALAGTNQVKEERVSQ